MLGRTLYFLGQRDESLAAMNRADLQALDTNNCGWKRLCDHAAFQKDCGDDRPGT